jgi:choline kinase
MHAVILAAGRGSRLGERTRNLPKCLTPLAGRPLLHWQLEALGAAGAGPVAVVRGYMAEKLAGPGYQTFDNPRWAETNMVLSLACAAPWLRAFPCLVAYSDILYGPGAVTALAAAPGDITLTYDRLWLQLWSERFQDPLADAESFRLDAAGNLVEIGRRTSSLADIQGQYMGLLKFTPAGWARVERELEALPQERRDRLDMTSLLNRLLQAGTPIGTVPVQGGWCEVDNPSDADLYERRLAGPGPWSHDWRGQGRRP